MTEFANNDSRKFAGFDVVWLEKWENLKLPTLIFCSFFSIENHLFKKW